MNKTALGLGILLGATGGVLGLEAVTPNQKTIEYNKCVEISNDMAVLETKESFYQKFCGPLK